MLKHKVAETKDAMQELVASNVVADYKINQVYDTSRKNKLMDQIFDITPHEDFIKDVIKANKDVKRRNEHRKIFAVEIA